MYVGLGVVGSMEVDSKKRPPEHTVAARCAFDDDGHGGYHRPKGGFFESPPNTISPELCS